MKTKRKEIKSLNHLGTALSREQLKDITGGRWVHCMCSSWPPVGWWGNYAGTYDAIVEINAHCGDAGGTCS